MTARRTRFTRAALAIGTVVTLTVGGAAALTAANAAPGAGTIAGTISDPSGYPLAGVTIRAFDAGGPAGTTTTNAAGAFRFGGLPTDGEADYRYRATDETGQHLTSSALHIIVKPGTTTTANLSLRLAGIIQGKVYTQHGSAALVPGKNIQVAADVGTDGGVSRSVIVSAKGGFRLGGLPTGSYYVSFDDVTQEYDEACYNNIRRTKQGCVGITKVSVTAGKTTTLSRQVLNHRLGILSGTVTDSAGQPLQGMKVEVLTSATDSAIPVTTSADGTWRKIGLDFVGSVRIRVSDSSGVYRTTWYASAASYATATPVAMKDGSEVKNLHITMPKN